MEKTIHIHTQEYLDEHCLLYKKQSGFCTNVSTDSCLKQFTNFILREIDKDFHTNIIIDDLQKAFDILDHNLPLQNELLWNELVPRYQSLKHLNHIS